VSCTHPNEALGHVRCAVLRDERRSSGDVRRDGLLAEHVLARLERGAHDVRLDRDREDDDNRLDVVARKQRRERSLRRRCAALRCDVVVDRWARRQVQRVLRVLRKPVRGLLRARVDGDEVKGRPVGGDLGKRGQMSCYAMNSPTK
jgi:hypothetical protein